MKKKSVKRAGSSIKKKVVLKKVAATKREVKSASEIIIKKYSKALRKLAAR